MKQALLLACALATATLATSAEVAVTMNNVDAKGIGASVGTVRVVETQYGLAFYPSLKSLQPGLHGFHVHEKPSCAAGEKDGKMQAAVAAGDHLDPAGSKKHGEPWGDGHLGDLPPLYVAGDGSANQPVLAPRLKMNDLKNRALMIHMGGDNHADHPAPLGGGAGRVACGVSGG